MIGQNTKTPAAGSPVNITISCKDEVPAVMTFDLGNSKANDNLRLMLIGDTDTCEWADEVYEQHDNNIGYLFDFFYDLLDEIDHWKKHEVHTIVIN